MNLNDRKTRILEAIINDYIATAEPIGSRTIAKKYNLGISSATIRNEMSDLEEMGLIVQPHASAGRVPSDKGYRLYVDSLMQNHDLTGEEANFLSQVIVNNVNHIDYLMKETAKAVAALTRCMTIITEPNSVNSTIKHMQLVPLDENSFVLVIISGDKTVKNKVIRTSNVPGYDILLNLTAILNANLSGCSQDLISSALIKKIESEFGEYSHLLIPVLENVFASLNDGNEMNIYTSGIKNILAFPEFSDLDKARAIFQTLEEKDMLITLLGDRGESDIQIIIGAENRLSHMQECSIIKTSYRLGGQNYGSIGILGPTRMDYPQIVSVLAAIAKNIKNVMNSLDDRSD